MVKTYGTPKIEVYVKIWLIELNEILNTKRPLKETQIDECAYLIVLEHKNLAIADLHIIFKKAKTGGYGELYETLSIDKILKWFNDYFNERCDVAGQMTREAHDKIKYQEERLGSGQRGQDKDKAFQDFKRNYQIDKLKKQYNEKQAKGTKKK